MAFDSVANFATSGIAVAPTPALSGTSLTVTTGDGSKFPATPFNMTVWPIGSPPLLITAEIVRVTNITGDVFTITRTQENTTARAIDTTYQISAGISAKTLTDIYSAINMSGSIKLYAGAAAPSGWLICDGSSVLRTTYANLFAVIGTNFGSVDGDHFNIPDMRGVVPAGYTAGKAGDFGGNFAALGQTGGELWHTLTVDELASHKHDFIDYNGLTYDRLGHNVNKNFAGSGLNPLSLDAIGNGDIKIKEEGSSNAHNNVQPYLTLNFIICI